MSIAVEKELPKGWAEATLEHTTEILDGRRIPINSRERENRKGSIPYYGATGQVGWIDDYIFDEELVLLGEDGAPFFENSKNKAYIVDGKSWVNNHAHVLKGKFGILENKFLLHLLNRIDYHDYVNGTTRLKLNQSSMRRIPIPLPPLNEQKRIVAKIEELFSLVDSAKDTLEKTKILLNQYRQSLLNSFFRNSSIKKSMSECCMIGTGGTPSRKKPEYYNGNIPWIKTGEIKNSYINQTEEKITQEGLENSNAKIFPEHSIIIAMYGEGKTRGRCGILSVPASTNQACAVLVCNSDILFYKYCFYWLISQYYKIRSIASGGNQPNLNLSKIKNLQIPLTTLEQQKVIVAKIEESFSLIEKNEILIEQLLIQYKQIKNSILKQAFEGKLVPQDPNDEPAEVLLERIIEEKNHVQ